jgi:hypothetical protein
MAIFPKPSADNRYLVDHVTLIRRSFKHWTGQDLVDPRLSDRSAAQVVFEAPFLLLSHNGAPDPIYTYGNQTALQLFAMGWAELTSMPSRLSAPPENRDDRHSLLATVNRQGFIDNYSGIRIAKTQQKFRLENVIVWNLLDAQGQYCGQAAKCDRWVFL